MPFGSVILARLLPIELRVREVAELYAVKQGKPLPEAPGHSVELRTPSFSLPHPANRMEIDFTAIDHIDDGDTTRARPSAPASIFTDGSKIEGRVGSAISCWMDGNEVLFKKYRLEQFCSVFQVELLALRNAIRLSMSDARCSNCDILSDSRSSLEAIANPRSTHPLVTDVRNDLSRAADQGCSIKLWWVRAHIGTAGNERADELAKIAALRLRSAAQYDRFPISYAKMVIRQRSLETWQEEYSRSPQGRVTKLFFPNINQAYRTIGKLGISYWLSQAWTGHGGNAHYLHRFGIFDSPKCMCSPDAEQTIEHALNECPAFGVMRLHLEFEVNTQITTSNWSYLISGDRSGSIFIEFCTRVMKRLAEWNKRPNILRRPRM